MFRLLCVGIPSVDSRPELCGTNTYFSDFSKSDLRLPFTAFWSRYFSLSATVHHYSSRSPHQLTRALSTLVLSSTISSSTLYPLPQVPALICTRSAALSASETPPRPASSRYYHSHRLFVFMTTAAAVSLLILLPRSQQSASESLIFAF